MHNFSCPQCGSPHFKRNGHTHHGKQNYQCLDCNRQFVSSSRLISVATKELVKKLLLERIPLRGICRALKISLPWLLSFIVELYERSPEDLNVEPVASTARSRRNMEFCRQEGQQAMDLAGTRHPNQASDRLLCGRSQPPQCEEVVAADASCVPRGCHFLHGWVGGLQRSDSCSAASSLRERDRAHEYH